LDRWFFKAIGFTGFSIGRTKMPKNEGEYKVLGGEE
jgi:hypothetical protein